MLLFLRIDLTITLENYKSKENIKMRITYKIVNVVKNYKNNDAYYECVLSNKKVFLLSQ
jgi:hypothetical protein